LEKLFFAQQTDQILELSFDAALFADRKRLPQDLRLLRVGLRVALGQPDDELLNRLEVVLDPLLIAGQVRLTLARGRHGILRFSKRKPRHAHGGDNAQKSAEKPVLRRSHRFLLVRHGGRLPI
jgi:hypothetical protein